VLDEFQPTNQFATEKKTLHPLANHDYGGKRGGYGG
jgi:hypothetical protein